MTDSALGSIYKGWETYQGHLIKALAPLTDEQLDLSGGPSLRTINGIAQHVVATHAFWYHTVAGVGRADVYASMRNWGHADEPPRHASDIVSGMRTTWELMQGALAQWTAIDLETPFTLSRLNRPDETITRQWIVWHVIEHDLHHGGEISMILGANGLTGLDV